MEFFDSTRLMLGGRADQTALFETLLRSRGVPMERRWGFRGSVITIPDSHAHLARQFLREYDRKEHIREITPEEYARYRQLFLLCLLLAIVSGIFIVAMIHSAL